MIFNIPAGGAAFISVTAPTGSTVTAARSGISVSRLNGGTIKVGATGTWTVTCVYDGTTKMASVNVTSLWATYSVAFTYTAAISVSTHPGAAVTATKGSTTLSGTADSGGACTLTVPAGGLGAWSVTANNGAVSETKSVSVAAYNSTYSVDLLHGVPVIQFTASGTTYTYKGAAIDNSVVKVSPVGTSGWKCWIRASCTVRFTFLKTRVDVCAIGKGGTGGNFSHPDNVTDYGGGGGEGGTMDTKNSQALALNTNYTVTIGSGSTFGSIASGSQGANASGQSGGGSGGTYRSGGNGAVTVDAWDGVHYSGPGSGGGGAYAFGDSTFDGTVYCHGGQGGDTGYGAGGRGSSSGVYANAGAGGPGGGEGASTGLAGKTGIVCMRNAA